MTRRRQHRAALDMDKAENLGQFAFGAAHAPLQTDPEFSRKENAMLKRVIMLALLAVCLVSAKNYTFSLAEPTQAGTVLLKPGEYTVKVIGSQVALVDNDGRRIDVSATVETANEKFDYTAILISKADGKARIEAVQLGGSKNKVLFQ
jgi:hypothetical protein